MTPLVSILIPCYNAEPWLARTLDSALAQTWPHKEIIVVNDGSKDRSLEIARRFESRGVTIIDQPNQGQSAAFNRAIAAARGDYLEFLDADDLLAPDKIAQQVALIDEASPELMIGGAWTRFTDDPAAVAFTPDEMWRDNLAPVDWLVNCWRQNLMMHGAAWLIPATLVRRAGGWNDALSLINDFEFFSRLMLQTTRVRFCAAARSYYRSELPNSLSGAKSPRAWLSAFTSLSLGTDRLLAAEDSPRTRDACAFVFRQFYFESYPLVPDLRVRAEARVRALGQELGQPDGGPVFKAMARVVGWRGAKRLQNFSYQHGYKRLAARWRQA
jgi:glycosyltransferase involved in cell wall biosynthesis